MGFLVVLIFIDSLMDNVNYARDIEVCMQSMICYLPGSIGYGSENFGLGSLHDDCWTCWRNPTALFLSSISV